MGSLRLASVVVIGLCCIVGAACAQEAGAPVMPAPAAVSAEPTIEWLWGEVVSVDATAGSLTVKYLDYETDDEKELALATDAKTTFENASALNLIGAGDTVSIDYVLEGSGALLAKNISVEKAHAAPVGEIATATAEAKAAAADAVDAQQPDVFEAAPAISAAAEAAVKPAIPAPAVPAESAKTGPAAADGQEKKAAGS